MPKDDERKEMTQEELDAREEKFRTFFTTSVAQVPEEMTMKKSPRACWAGCSAVKRPNSRKAAHPKRVVPARYSWAAKSRRNPPTWSWS